MCSYVPSVGAWHQTNVSAVPFVHVADLWRTAELLTLSAVFLEENNRRKKSALPKEPPVHKTEDYSSISQV